MPSLGQLKVYSQETLFYNLKKTNTHYEKSNFPKKIRMKFSYLILK